MVEDNEREKMPSKYRLNLYNEKECRERLKKAIKVMGDVYFNFNDEDAHLAFVIFALAIDRIGLKSIKTDDLERWFNERGRKHERKKESCRDDGCRLNMYRVFRFW